MSTFQTTEQRRSKKMRHCDWCTSLIVGGETYEHWFGLNDDNDPMAFNSHLECREAIEREAAEEDWEAVTWGEGHHRGKTYEETHGRKFD